MYEGWFSLAGVVLGIAGTQGFNLWTEKSRGKREDRHRFHQAKRLVYVKFRALATWIALADSRRPGFLGKLDEILFANSEIQILGDKKVMEATEKLWDLISQDINSSTDSEELPKLVAQFDDAARDAIAP